MRCLAWVAYIAVPLTMQAGSCFAAESDAGRARASCNSTLPCLAARGASGQGLGAIQEKRGDLCTDMVCSEGLYNVGGSRPFVCGADGESWVDNPDDGGEPAPHCVAIGTCPKVCADAYQACEPRLGHPGGNGAMATYKMECVSTDDHAACDAVGYGCCADAPMLKHDQEISSSEVEGPFFRAACKEADSCDLLTNQSVREKGNGWEAAGGCPLIASGRHKNQQQICAKACVHHDPVPDECAGCDTCSFFNSRCIERRWLRPPPKWGAEQRLVASVVGSSVILSIFMLKFGCYGGIFQDNDGVRLANLGCQCAVLPTATALICSIFTSSEDLLNTPEEVELLENERLKLFCMLVTLLLSVAPLMPIVQTFRESIRNLEEVPEISLPPGKNMHGWFGLILWFKGVAGIFVTFFFCIKLFHSEEWVLCTCATVTFVATTGTTVFLLTFEALPAVMRKTPAAKAYKLENSAVTALAQFFAISRIQSFTIVRLQLCGRELLSMPMSESHFHFLKNAGLYHHLIEDIPCLVVGIASITMHINGSPGWLPLSAEDWACAKIALSAGSLVYGFIDNSSQLLAIFTAPNGAHIFTTTSAAALAAARKSLFGSSSTDSSSTQHPEEEQFAMLPFDSEQESDEGRIKMVSRATA